MGCCCEWPQEDDDDGDWKGWNHRRKVIVRTQAMECRPCSSSRCVNLRRIYRNFSVTIRKWATPPIFWGTRQAASTSTSSSTDYVFLANRRNYSDLMLRASLNLNHLLEDQLKSPVVTGREYSQMGISIQIRHSSGQFLKYYPR